VSQNGQAVDPVITPSSTVSHTQLVTADGKLLCPNCEQANHVQWYKGLDKKIKYADELNQVYVCEQRRGGCGHIFSPGDHRVIVAYLSGQLVPRALVEELAEERVKQAREEGRQQALREIAEAQERANSV
jgi:hypothetical protein